MERAGVPPTGRRTYRSSLPRTLPNLILMHFLSKLRCKAVINPSALQLLPDNNKKSHRMNAPPPPPPPPLFLFDTQRTCFFSSREPVALLGSRWEMSSHARAEAAAPHRVAASGGERGERTSSQSPWRLTSLLNLCKKKETRQSKVNQYIASHSCYHENKRPDSLICIHSHAMYVCNSN